MQRVTKFCRISQTDLIELILLDNKFRDHTTGCRIDELLTNSNDEPSQRILRADFAHCMAAHPQSTLRRCARIILVIENQGKASMECKVQWVDGMTFLAETGSGHTLVMDGPPDAGGRNLAPRPMETLLAGTGGCTAFDVVMILKKSRQAVTGVEVSLKATRAEIDPKVFTHIHFHFRVTGRDLKPEVVERAVKLSAEKYCSASIMLGKTAEISHDWEIVPEQG